MGGVGLSRRVKSPSMTCMPFAKRPTNDARRLLVIQISDQFPQDRRVIVANGYRIFRPMPRNESNAQDLPSGAQTIVLCSICSAARRAATAVLRQALSTRSDSVIPSRRLDVRVHVPAKAIACDIERAALAHIDETGWREAGQRPWLWVLVALYTALYMICARTAGMLDNALGAAFAGVPMSDGHSVYQARAGRIDRLPCHWRRQRDVRTLRAAENGGLRSPRRRPAGPDARGRLDPRDRGAATDLCERHRED